MITMDAILLGGGVGKRYSEGQTAQSQLPKQYQMLGNSPVFIHATRAFLAMNCFRHIIIAAPEPHIGLTHEQLDEFLPDRPRNLIRVITGGDRRQDSSRLALEAAAESPDLPARVLIHDACRPFISAALAARVREKLFDRSYGAWIPVVPVTETLKKIENSQVVETVDRSVIHRVQTPQIFEYSLIRSLVEKTKDLTELTFTDDASLCEYYGIPVGVFEGDVRNIKLTYEFEMQALKTILSEPKEFTPCAQESATTFTV